MTTISPVFGPYRGVVDHVHDGDTIDIRLDAGFDLTVYARCRIYGIDAPELATPEGKAARDFAQELVEPGDAVGVVSHGWDKYGGRIDASVALSASGQDFAAVMLANGHAKPWSGRGPKP